jgi:hypothetical protein
MILASSGQPAIPSGSLRSSIQPRKSTHTIEAVMQHRDPSTHDSPYRTILQKLHISPDFFGASVFAARIPLVSADTGEDFSNNLFTDLAPILALFGEQVAWSCHKVFA